MSFCSKCVDQEKVLLKKISDLEATLAANSNELNKQDQHIKQIADEKTAILKSAKFTIITTDLDGIITVFNDEAEKILGYTAAEVVGQHTPALFHDPVEIAEVAKLLSIELNQEIPIGFETFIVKANIGISDERQWSYIHKNGHRTQIMLNVTALKDTSGLQYGYMGIGKDLTEEHQILAQLNLERSKAIRNSKLATLGEMSAGIAHEINNPLAIISGSIELLRMHLNEPEKLEAKIESIQRACDRISKIVNSLKKFSRSNERSVYLHHRLSDIVKEVIVLTESKAKRHDTSVLFECRSSSLINCDEVEIEQVLVNLINNGIDAVKDYSKKWIKIFLFDEDGVVVIRVMDSGHGIPEKIRTKIFEPFFTTKKIGEGTGLGLSIAKGIIDEHNATIGILENFPNTCFELRFPRVHEDKSVSSCRIV